MSDIRLNGSRPTSYTPDVEGTPSVPNSSQVHTTSVDPTTPEDENSALLGTDNSESLPPEGDVPDPTASAGEPDPNGDPMARAAWLEEELEKQEDYAELAEQLQYIVESGGPDAAQSQVLLTKLQQAMWLPSEIEDAQEELDELADFLPDADLDGDGRANVDDPDIDGDGLIQAADPDAYNQDMDGDGITDYGEKWLQQHNYSYDWMDANNADANSNGIVDGLELPDAVKIDNNGKPIIVGYKPEEGSGTGGGSTGGVGSNSNSYQWNPPSSGAQTINAADGDQTVSADYDVVVNFNGEDSAWSKDGNDLLIESSAGTIRVTGYYGEDGQVKGKVYAEGTLGSVSTNNGSNMFTASDTNGDGYADAGVHFSSPPSGVTNNYDPFEGNVDIDEAASTEDMVAYESGSGNFKVPSEIDGEAVKAIDLEDDGEYVLVICKGSINGEPLKTFRVPKSDVESGDVHFTLADNGQYFYADVECVVDGGKGDDEITILKGGTARGNDGSDMLRGGEGDSTLDGGRGDDFVLGGSGTDTLIGGDDDDGMDFLHSGSSTGDTLRSGDGDDILIVENTSTTADYNVDAGEGIDLFSGANTDDANSDHGVEVDVANPADIMSYLEAHKAEANSDLLEELEKLHNGEGTGTLDWAGSAASETLKDAANAFLVRKKQEWDSKYGGTHGETFGSGSSSSETPEAEGDATSQSNSTPGLMFQSVGVEVDEKRKRQRREENEEDGTDIPSPMFD